MLEHGLRELEHVVDRRREAAVEQGARTNGEHQGLRGARAGAPGDQLLAFVARARGAHQRQNGFDHGIADRQPAYQPLGAQQGIRAHSRLGQRLLGAGGFEQDAPLGVAIWIVDIDFHQEAVELRFGQGIGAFLLQRVLRRQHMERLWQVMPSARNRDVLFLHGLQQRRLGARAGAIDLVRHQELREHGAGDETERALSRRALIQHFSAENVRRHQVGRELDALCIKTERNAERLDQLGLGEAGDADQKRVSAGKDRHQRVLDDAVLAENDGGNRLFRRTDLRGNLLGGADDAVFEFFDAF